MGLVSPAAQSLGERERVYRPAWRERERRAHSMCLCVCIPPPRELGGDEMGAETVLGEPLSLSLLAKGRHELSDDDDHDDGDDGASDGDGDGYNYARLYTAAGGAAVVATDAGAAACRWRAGAAA